MQEHSYIHSFSLFLIILALVMTFYNWKVNKNIIYLSLFLIIFSISIESYNLLIFGGSIQLFAVLLANFAPLYFLSGPLIYFFIRGIVSDESKFRKTDTLHLIPFFINLIAIAPYIFTSFDFKLEIAKQTMQNFVEYRNYDFKLFYPHYINNIGRALQMIIYVIVSLNLLRKSYNEIKLKKGLLQKQFYYVYHWLFIFLLLVLIISISHMLVGYSYTVTDNLQSIKEKLFALINLAVFIYLLIPGFILFNPKILYGMPKFSIAPEQSAATENIKEKNNAKQKTIIDEDSIAHQLTEDILKFLNNEKPYLKPDFSVHDICIYFNRPQHHIYYCFTNVLKKNFSDIKKELRIKYALELLSTNAAENVSMDGIGRQAGFASNSNFYACFKDIVLAP